MRFLILIFIITFANCKTEKLLPYKDYVYKFDPTTKNKENDVINDYIKKISSENNIHFITITNPTAYIPPMCYTKTEDISGLAHNPCYSCHTSGKEPNFLNDSDLQTHYDFPEHGKINPWKNLFINPQIKSISNSEIENYIREDNYLNSRNEIHLANNLPEDWGGYRPDCFFNFDDEGFDINPKTKEFTGWRAYRYYPFPGSFLPTNGSTDDVLIRLPFPFRADEKGIFNLEIYKTNLAIVEAVVKQRTIPTESLDEKISGIDLDGNEKLEKSNQLIYNWPLKKIKYAGLAKEYQIKGELLLAGGLFPVGTEFLHSVRYIDQSNANYSSKLSRRMKELRYAQKRDWFTYADLKEKISRERKDIRFRTEKLPEGFNGDFEHGFDNKIGWIYSGFIEDKKGNLRPQTNEETLYCMGCHSSLGVLADSTFSFTRKLEGIDKSKPDIGWGHWSHKDTFNLPDRTVKFLNFGEKREYSFYLENNSAGDEFRENEEIKKKFFLNNGKFNSESFKKLESDINTLLTPSEERRLLLNKSYKSIVNSQSFQFGRDSNLHKSQNIHKKISEGQITKINKIIF